jgi:hypothetical protein
MYTSRITTIAETEAGNMKQRQKYAFLESVLEGKEEKGHFNSKSGQAHTSTSAQAQQGGNQVKEEVG